MIETERFAELFYNLVGKTLLERVFRRCNMDPKRIDAVSLCDLLESGGIKLVDVRGEESFDAEHIPGAISVPLKGFPDNALDMLDMNDRIVTYCTNIACSAGPTAAEKLVEMGYRDVSVLPVGIEGWKGAGFKTLCPSCV